VAKNETSIPLWALLRFSFLEYFVLQGISDMKMVLMIFYTFYSPKGLLLRNISKSRLPFYKDLL